MKNTNLALISFLVMCVFFAATVSAEEIVPNLTAPQTVEPTKTTTEPTKVPTTLITVEPTTKQTTVPTTEPLTLRPTLMPTLTITVEPTMVGGGKGWIDTYCNVDGASVYYDGSYQGTISGGSLSVAVSPEGTPIRTVSVQKSGYTTWSGALSRMPRDKEHVSVYATINPVTTIPTTPPVQNGAIYAQSSPGGAAIYVNGQFYGYSPLTIPNLPPGAYSMKATLSGYTPDTRFIGIEAGQTAPYYPILQPSPQPPRTTGTVTVTSSPTSALVYVDGVYQGKSPISLTLYPGNHQIDVSLSGYTSSTSTVYVTAGSSQTLPVSLVPAVYGTVAITSTPGASVYMDSNGMGLIPSSGTLVLYNVANGNHIFKVTAPGYNEWMNTVYIRPNTQTNIAAPLTPVGTNPTPIPSTGGFSISSTPTGAEVFVDNLFRGYTPTTLTDITPGEHRVILKYTGYVDYSITVTVNSGVMSPLDVRMNPAPTPTPKSALSPALVIGGLAAFIAISATLRRRS
jgi:hypothetical protein